MSTADKQLAARRRAIFASCRQLGIGEDERRALLVQVAGVASTTALTLEQADQVLDHLRKAGAEKPSRKPVGRHRGAPSTLDREPYYQKIEALLADMGLPWSYAEAIAENITGGKAGGIKRLAWVRKQEHLTGVVSALSAHKQKRLVAAWNSLAEKLHARGLDTPWCAEQAAAMGRLRKPWKWDQCLETLAMIEERLP